MEFVFDVKKGRASFRFIMDEDDISRTNELQFSMNDVEIFVDLGRDFDEDDLHPDLICLSAILLCSPFVGSKLEIPFPISETFFEGANKVFSKYNLDAKTHGVNPIEKNPDGRAGLAFSGGADSSAALSVMPADTVPIFLNRPMSRKSQYDSSAPLAICSELIESGYEVKIISSDLEKLRNPIGFPTDLSNAVPAILLSKSLNLDSIAFGTVMESAFRIGHEKFVDYGNSAHWRFHGSLFENVGLELSLPIIGVSEVGTSIIVNNSPLGIVSQSCIRGSLGDPCLKCWKCFRKQLLGYSIGFIESPEMLGMLNSNEVQTRLSSFPISHENVIIFALQRVDLDSHPYLKPIADKLDMSLNLDYLGSWYSESIEFVPDKYRHYIRDKILSHLPPMTPEGEYSMNSWDMMPHLESIRAKMAQEKLTSYWQDLAHRFGS